MDHHARIVADLPESPALVGHSFGGLVVQALLDRQVGRAGVAIDPAPIRGVLRVPPAQLRAAFPVLSNPANRRRAVSLTPAQFRANFGNALANMTPRARAAAAVDTRRAQRGPLLIISGGADRTVPDSVSRAAFKLYGRSAAVTEFRQFPDRGHSLTVDSGWPEIADAALGWLAKQGIGGPTPPA
jgi:non-heme chloroperoxidase